MNSRTSLESFAIVFCAACLSACAGTDTLISSPTVDLTSVELTAISLKRQNELAKTDCLKSRFHNIERRRFFGNE